MLLLWLCLLITISFASSMRTLILIDKPAIKLTHSNFIQTLTDRGHTVTIREAFDDTVTLEKYGNYLYDNLVLFTPSTEDFGSISASAIIKFIDSGRNVLLAANENITEPFREIAEDMGISIDPEQTMVIDHLHYSDLSHTGDHTVIGSSNLLQSEKILGSDPYESPVLFKGIGHVTFEETGRRFIYVLRGNESTYSAKPFTTIDSSSSSSLPASFGAHTLLVTAIQTHNNARFVFSGSLEMFSNAFWSSAVVLPALGQNYPQSANQQFCTELSRWVFGERGLVRVRDFKHYQAVTNENDAEIVYNPQGYRVSDMVNISLELEEFDLSRGWIGFDATDVQLELTMLDPYLRFFLSNKGNGHYEATIKLPDVYGVYKFVLDHHRLGLGTLKMEKQVILRPFYHNEYDRFLLVATPYYSSVFVIAIAFALFNVMFLYSKDN